MKFKEFILASIFAFGIYAPICAQINWSKAASAGLQAIQAVTVTDKQMAEYAKESVNYMDKNNKIADANSEYAKRLNRLTNGLNDANGLPLNFKVYMVSDINAFACPDGSVRVFSALMDIMTDDELLGVIGHEIGHVAKHHSKKGFKQQLLTGAARSALSATNGYIAALSDSQLGELSASLIGAKYSQKQEKEADDYGYDFLKANGKNPWGMVMAFEKLQSMESGGSTSYIARMFSSHPDTSARIARMEKRAKKDRIPRPAASK